MREKITEDSRPAIAQSVVRTPISADAYRAIAVSSMRLLLEERRGSQGGYFFSVDQVTLNKLMAARRRYERFSDMMIRMTKTDAASERSSRYVGAAGEQQARSTSSRYVVPSV
jgi:hypothetical protein